MSTMTATPTVRQRLHQPRHPAGDRPVGATRHQRPAQSGSVRLTRRGRLVVLSAAVVAVLAIGFLFASGSVATDEPGTPPPTRVVQVGAGDTLWDIAAGIADEGDVRAVVAEIEDLNALDSGMVVAGQKLVVPAG